MTLYQSIYGCLGIFAAAVAPFVALFSRRIRKGLGNYLGIMPPLLGARKIWFHGVSIGESSVAKALMKELKSHRNPLNIGFTTTHPDVFDGFCNNSIAGATAFFPLDLIPFMRNAFRLWTPEAVILSETDFWPAFSMICRRKKIPLILVNGRISDKLLYFYRSFPPLSECVFHSFSLFCVQTIRDKEKLLQLGVDESIIRITGNIKADIASDLLIEVSQTIRGWKENSRIAVFGSIHPSEFVILSEILPQLMNISDLKIILAPRNIQNAVQWKTSLKTSGIPAILRTELAHLESASERILILDTIGELAGVYSLSSVAMIGGTLDPQVGGHNPIEAAAVNVPIIAGPNYRNFTEFIDELHDVGGVKIVKNAPELLSALTNILENPDLASKIACEAESVLKRHKGALKKTIEAISDLLDA